MDKQLKDYIKYYIGCDVTWKEDGSQKYSLRAVNVHDLKCGWKSCYIFIDADDAHWVNVEGIALHLRPISSMTAQEMNECGNLVYDFSNEPELNTWDYRYFETTLCSEQWDWLIKREFDLFGLIDAGLAIDKETIKS